MKQTSGPDKTPAEAVIKDIRRATRRQFSSEEKIRVVLEGLRGEDSVAELCRRVRIAASLHYGWPQTLKSRILLEHADFPGELEARIEGFVEHDTHCRFHESLGNLTPADVYFGRGVGSPSNRGSASLDGTREPSVLQRVGRQLMDDERQRRRRSLADAQLT